MSLLLDALQKKNRSRPPVWLMRQAGRYMPQYQGIRKKYGLNEMFREKDLIVQTTLLPLHLLDVDALILFSDILTVLYGLGKQWTLEESVGPVINPIKRVTDLEKREPHEVYSHIKEALLELKRTIKCPLIGFAGGPLTIAAYLVEGKMSKDMHILKRWIYEDPKQFHQILHFITEATIDYLKLQMASGIDVVQIFDSWAGLLAPAAFQEFSLFYLKKLRESVPSHIPFIIFTRGSCLYASDLCSLNPDAISFDWQKDMKKIAQEIPSEIALQGNLDPGILLGSWEYIKKDVDSLLNAMKGSPRYIFNLGHGVLPQTPFSTVKRLIDYVKSA